MTINMSKVLMISIDQSIFDKNSSAFARIREYASLADELHVIVLKNGERYEAGNLSVYSSGNYFAARDLSKKLVEQRALEVVTTQDPFLTGSIGRMLKKKYGIKFNAQLHGDFFSPYFRKESLKNFIFYWYMRLVILPVADNFRVVSQRIKNELMASGIGESKIIVAPIYVDLKKYAERVASHQWRQKYDSERLILSIGSLVKVKNVPLLIQAFKSVLPFFPKATLLLVGAGPRQRSLSRLVARLGLKKQIQFLGKVADPRSLLQEADCLVLPSWHEGYGRVIIEAMAAGLPVAMSNVGLAGEIVMDNKNGLVFPVGRLDLLTHLLIDVLSDANLRSRLSNEARQTLLSLPPKEIILEKIKQSWAV